MFEHNINPIIFQVGMFQLTYYALVYLIGFIAALLILLNAAKKKEINLRIKDVYLFMALAILGIIIGARAFHIIFWDFEFFSRYPAEIPKIWRGGLSFHGGLLGAILISILFTKWKKVNFWILADTFALLGILMPVFSRIVNFINQEIVGTITDIPWCFKFKFHDGCRHPVQLYAAVGRLAFFSALLIIKRKIKTYRHGFLFWMSLTGVAIGRFFLDFWREDIRYVFLSVGQWFSLIILIIGTYALYFYYKDDIRKLTRG